MLRQQSASVASTASSTSNSLTDSIDQAGHNATILSSVPPTSSRRHRSSSSLSSRNSHSAPLVTSTNVTNPISISSTAGIAPPRETSVPHFSRDPLSRQSSVASRRSEASSPSLSSSLIQGDISLHPYSRRPSTSAPHTQLVSGLQSSSIASNPRSSHMPATSRYEEAAYARMELESVRRENEELKDQIRDLERALSSRRSGTTSSQDLRASSDAGNASMTGLSAAGQNENASRLDANPHDRS